MMMKKLMIKTNTKKGFEIAEDGDSICLAYPNSKVRHSGRIKKQVCYTLDTTGDIGVVIDEEDHKDRKCGTGYADIS